MSEERKASEILIELEGKINNILQLYQNMDNNIKLILAKLNSSEKRNKTETKFSPAVSSGPTLISTLPPEPPKPSLEEELPDFPEALPKVMKAVLVQQRLNYNDQSPITLATYEIFDENHKSIRKSRTNSVGKWNATLAPGSYTIKITKNPSGIKPAINQEYKITIPQSSSPIELSQVTL